MFWTEFEDFHSKTGCFQNREHIWHSTDIINGHSYLWHKKNSLRYSYIFGKVGCRVCSKILGIGSAERNWGDVKHLKSNKRASLSGERTKKQATVFGAACVEKKNIEMRRALQDNSGQPIKFWTEDDFDAEFDMLGIDATEASTRRPTRLFLSFEEPWEKDVMLKQDPVSEARLLKKYGGLQWYDPDDEVMCFSDSKKLEWVKPNKRKKEEGGYHVVAYDENYEKDSETAEYHLQPWAIGEDLRLVISEYYTKHKEFGVVVVQSPTGEKELDKEDDSDVE